MSSCGAACARLRIHLTGIWETDRAMTTISRRTLLSRTVVGAAVLVGAAAGVGRRVHHRVAVPPAPPPAALVAVLTAQGRLLDGFDQVVATGAAAAVLPALRADIEAHGSALRALLEAYPGWRYRAIAAGSGGPSASPSPSTAAPVETPVAGDTAQLVAGIAALATLAARTCQQWPAGEQQAAQVVPLLGSMAAALRSQQDVLS